MATATWPTPEAVGEVKALAAYLAQFPTRYRHTLAAFGFQHYESILKLEQHVLDFRAEVEALIPKPEPSARYWGTDYQETDAAWLETQARREHDRQVEDHEQAAT